MPTGSSRTRLIPLCGAGDFFVGQGNRLPAFAARLLVTDSSGKWVAKDLTGRTVTFKMSPIAGCRSGSKTLSAPATAVSAKGGGIQYDWAAGDTDIPGYYRAVVSVTEAGGGIVTDFPNDGYQIVRIRPKLD